MNALGLSNSPAEFLLCVPFPLTVLTDGLDAPSFELRASTRSTDLFSSECQLSFTARDSLTEFQLHRFSYISPLQTSKLRVGVLLHCEEILVLFQNLVEASHILGMLCSTKCEPEWIEAPASLVGILLLVARHPSGIVY